MSRGLMLILIALGAMVATMTIIGVLAAPRSPDEGPLVEIPRVIGQKQADAERRLRDAGFEVVASTAPNRRRRGIVFDQQPSAGEQIPRGKVVFVDVSEGATSPVVVPQPG